MPADEAYSAPARAVQITSDPLEAAMALATASRTPSSRKLHTTKAENAAARADLEARACAGQTVQGRNRLGQFTRGVKVSTFGRQPAMGQVIQFRRPANEGLNGRAEIRSAWEAAKAEHGQPTPTPDEVNALLMATMVTAMSKKARKQFYDRFQRLYDGAAGDQKRQEIVKTAAYWVCAPLKTAAI